MKVYNLSCSHEHPFEGWFSSEADFLRQSDARLIECPVCSDRGVRRMPSAPRLNLSAAAQEQAPAAATLERLRQQWMKAAQEIIANTEDVGTGFAEEARRIHYRETAARGIRGVASEAERQALDEEGIEVLQFPLPAASKQSLQ